MNVRIFFILLICAVPRTLYSAEKLSADDLVSRNLESIGTEASRNAIKSLLLQGKLTFKVLVGGGGELQGTWGEVSEQEKRRFVMRFGGGYWRGEDVVFDGSRVAVAALTSTHAKSALGSFLYSEDFLLKEGLLGGELSTGWALEHLAENRPKLSYAGLKKVDGHELYDLQYVSRRSSDVEIHLYFDPESFHHVETFYRIELASNMSRAITQSASMPTVRYTFEERFGGFKTMKGLTLPTTYSIEYTQEQPNGRTAVYLWEMIADDIEANRSLDPHNFDVK